ncbi:sigma-E factor negative regulatory protein [Thiohalobacter sp. IOR34]|uniref:sigma-E factor negative regulatory protein n=1 Tax=Thiohalobacter sp. IOR34 TaxID=3057176 RepID=UPI0025AECF9E|nr:sigma-E factor negative regulatory protein [Thiohalobacter sp. IOR34]WJW76133.1 sigma-E factor negative regulatory protein [Thiohalobacter sp. IOR34]
MNDKISEQVSALVDDQLPEAEQDMLLARLERDPALRAQWTHYQLISDALRNQLPEQVDLGLAGRVMAELEAEPAHHGRAGLGRLLRPLAGAAVAASVAVVAVLALQDREAALPSAGGQLAEATMPAADQYRRVAGTRWDVKRPQLGEELNQYLVNHNEYAARSGLPAMSPHVRIVGYASQRPLQQQR